MSTSIPYGGRYPEAVDVVAKEPKAESKTTKFRFVAFLLLLVASMYGATSWFRIDSLKADQATQMTRISELNAQVATLKSEAKGTETLRSELARVKTDLLAEVDRKKKLAFENSKLLGRVTQGERDLAIALEKLKAFEKPKLKPKK